MAFSLELLQHSCNSLVLLLLLLKMFLAIFIHVVNDFKFIPIASQYWFSILALVVLLLSSFGFPSSPAWGIKRVVV